jgi:ABC-2 type transport system permease protein
MKERTFVSVVLSVAARSLRAMTKSPFVFIASLAFPMLFFLAFVGALSSVTKVKGFSGDYQSFQYVFALMMLACFQGAAGGSDLAQDFDSGFIRRLWVGARRRGAIVTGYVLATFIRFAIAAAGLTGVAFAFGMDVTGKWSDLLMFYGLAALVNLFATLWSAGIATQLRSTNAAPAMILPMFLLLFLAPVFAPLALMTGWLHDVARFDPMTRFLEAGRGLLVGAHVDLPLAFGLAGGLFALTLAWAALGVRSAEAAGP